MKVVVDNTEGKTQTTHLAKQDKENDYKKKEKKTKPPQLESQCPANPHLDRGRLVLRPQVYTWAGSKDTSAPQHGRNFGKASPSPHSRSKERVESTPSTYTLPAGERIGGCELLLLLWRAEK